MTPETICAIATAPGGALGIVRISGPNALSAIRKLCPSLSESIKPRTQHFCTIHDGDEILDEALVTFFQAPNSYTGEDAVEVSCHGSAYILRRLLELLVGKGCRLARPGEFTQRAFMNGRLDLSQAEAVADLISASNHASQRLAMSQLRGGISSELSALRDHLLRLTSLLELELDFSDHEDLEFADRKELLALARRIHKHIHRLADSFHAGNALKQGIPVAIVGAPNVGKSTLLNQLLGEERAIVSDIQGTTRDAIEDIVTIRDVTFRFIDTAGIRHTSDKVEQMGIERSLSAARRARIVILMTEPGVPYPHLDLRDDQTLIRIENKTPHFQAKFGIGLDVLREQLLSVVPTMTDSDVVVTNARHYEVLCRAQEAMQRVIDGMGWSHDAQSSAGDTQLLVESTAPLPGDLLAEDLRDVLSILAEITGGAITSQETLNNIFQHFCVGK